MIFHQVLNSYSGNYNSRIYQNIVCDLHFHGNFELIYTFEGTTSVTVNGITQTLDAGELILIPPYMIHSLQVKNATSWVGVFSEDFIASFSRKHKFACYSKFRCSRQIEQLLKENLFTLETPPRYLHMAYLYMVCNECIHNATPLSPQLDDKFMYEVISYISDNIRQDLTMQRLADVMNYEYHYFSALFHKCFAINFKSFINIFRFEKACSLLSTRDLPSARIAEECGFGSVRNFNRVFKDLSGYTPNEYKNQKQDASLA